MGTVLLRRRPLKPLTREQYLLALSDRIDRLIAKETPERAKEILAPIEAQENLSLRFPGQAGEALAESERLRELSGANGRFPVPLSKLTHDPRAEDRLEAETLEEFVNGLMVFDPAE
jgi:hypothetical protein